MNKFTEFGKYFFSFIGLAALVLSYLCYVVVKALHSGESTDTVLYTYHTYDRIISLAVPAVFVLSLILSNIGFLKYQRGIFFLIPFIVFAAFTLLDYAYLSDEYFRFRKNAGLWKGEFSIAVLMGLFICFVAGSITVINYLILVTYKKYIKK
jgi:hypothetical protein